MMQKTIQLTKDYLKNINSKGHRYCYKCNKELKVNDTVHVILRNTGKGLSKYYHIKCWEKTLY